MPKITGLVRRGGRYSFRRGVPEALRTATGAREVQVTLGTSDHAVVVRKAREAAVATDGLFERARMALRNGEPLSAHRNPLRPLRPYILLRNLLGRNRPILAVVGPEPKQGTNSGYYRDWLICSGIEFLRSNQRARSVLAVGPNVGSVGSASAREPAGQAAGR